MYSNLLGGLKSKFTQLKELYLQVDVAGEGHIDWVSFSGLSKLIVIIGINTLLTLIDAFFCIIFRVCLIGQFAIRQFAIYLFLFM